MYAVTFEANIVSEFLRIPNFEQLKNKHVRVVIEEDQQGLLHYDLNLEYCVAVDNVIAPKNYSWNEESTASTINLSNTLDSVNGCKKIFNLFNM